MPDDPGPVLLGDNRGPPDYGLVRRLPDGRLVPRCPGLCYQPVERFGLERLEPDSLVPLASGARGIRLWWRNAGDAECEHYPGQNLVLNLEDAEKLLWALSGAVGEMRRT